MARLSGPKLEPRGLRGTWPRSWRARGRSERGKRPAQSCRRTRSAGSGRSTVNRTRRSYRPSRRTLRSCPAPRRRSGLLCSRDTTVRCRRTRRTHPPPGSRPLSHHTRGICCATAFPGPCSFHTGR
eukprot:1070183-Rhodomonas_salina.1